MYNPVFLKNSICVTGDYISLGQSEFCLILSKLIGAVQNQAVLCSGRQPGSCFSRRTLSIVFSIALVGILVLWCRSILGVLNWVFYLGEEKCPCELIDPFCCSKMDDAAFILRSPGGSILERTGSHCVCGLLTVPLLVRIGMRSGRALIANWSPN